MCRAIAKVWSKIGKGYAYTYPPPHLASTIGPLWWCGLCCLGVIAFELLHIFCGFTEGEQSNLHHHAWCNWRETSCAVDLACAKPLFLLCHPILLHTL